MITAIWIAFKFSVVIGLVGLVFLQLLKPADARWIRNRAIPVTIGLFWVGMLSPNIWVMYGVIVLCIPALARSRAEAACLFMLIALGLPRLEHEVMAGGHYILGWDKWMVAGVGALIACFIYPAKGTRPATRFDVPFLLFLALMFIQTRGEANLTTFVRKELDVLFSYLIPYFAVTRLIRRPEDVRSVLITTAFGFFVLSAMALYEYRTSVLIYEMINQRQGSTWGLGGYTHIRGGHLRAHTTLEDSTLMAFCLSLGVLILLPLRDAFRSRMHHGVALLLLLAGIYATGSRGAILGLALGVLSYDLYCRRYGAMIVKAAGLGMAYVSVMAAANISPVIAARVGLNGDAAGSVDYRHLMIVRGLQEIRKHPLIGLTPDQIATSLQDLVQGEGFIDFINGYIYFGLIAGFFGMAAILLCFVLNMARAWLDRGRVRRDARMLRLGAVAFAMASETALICGTSGFGGRPAILFFLFTNMCLVAIATRQKRPWLGNEGGQTRSPEPTGGAYLPDDRELPDRARADAAYSIG